MSDPMYVRPARTYSYIINHLNSILENVRAETPDVRVRVRVWDRVKVSVRYNFRVGRLDYYHHYYHHDHDPHLFLI
jgi:hypothetical protein